MYDERVLHEETDWAVLDRLATEHNVKLEIVIFDALESLVPRNNKRSKHYLNILLAIDENCFIRFVQSFEPTDTTSRNQATSIVFTQLKTYTHLEITYVTLTCVIETFPAIDKGKNK